MSTKVKTRAMYRLMVAALVFAAVVTAGAGGAQAASSVVVGGIGYIAGQPGDQINLRSGPSTIYAVNVKLTAGQAVEVYDGPRRDSEGSLWYKVRNENGGGWVRGDYLVGNGSSSKSNTTSSSTSSPQQASNTGSAAKIKIGGAVKVTDDSLRVRSAASKSGTVLTMVNGGTVLKVVDGPVTDAAGNTWYKVSGTYTVGWVSADYLAFSSATPPTLASDSRSTSSRGGAPNSQPVVAKPQPVAQQSVAQQPAAQQPAPAQPAPQQAAPAAAQHSAPAPAAAGIIGVAERYLGYRYVYGGMSPRGFDCSGFVAYVLNSSGFNVSRDMYSLLDSGTRVKSSELQPGDLVFFVNTYRAGVSHIGIYIGGGRFIHAENESTGVTISDLWNSYYSAHYYAAVRISR